MILIYIYIRTATKRLHVTFRRIFSFCLLNFKSIIKNSKINRKVNMIMKKKKKYLAGFTTKLVQHILQTGTKRELRGTSKKRKVYFSCYV